MSYRMVKRKYFCHLCKKEFNHMVSAYEPLNCIECHQGFVELIEKPHTEAEDVDEEKRRVNEQYRLTPTDVSQLRGNRVDPYDRNPNNIYGVPDDRRRMSQREEEDKKN